MNTIDMILQQIGQPTDGLGPNWSPLERIVHKFHMKDLWAKIRSNYDMVVMVGKLTDMLNMFNRTITSYESNF